MGFTVITGKNNSGKSAVQRAIRGVFQNAGGTPTVWLLIVGVWTLRTAIRLLGEKEKENKYVINGKEYDKVGAKTPEPQKIFWFRNYYGWGSGDMVTVRPTVTGQVFLLNDTGSVLADHIRC